MFLTILSLILLLSQNVRGDLAQINSLFRPADPNSNSSCAGVDKFIRGCHDCYNCENPSIAGYQSEGVNVQHLKLTDSRCTTSELCCVSQTAIRTRDTGSCGLRVTVSGKRLKPRSVLLGEFPWMATIVRKSRPDKPLCAANVIDDTTATLLAPASCVFGINANDLLVSFSMPPGTLNVAISRTLLNPNYQAGRNDSNLALIFVRSAKDVPKFVNSICLPSKAVLHGIACHSTSSDVYLINTNIALKSRCVGESKTSKSLFCAFAAADDYQPMVGASIFCEEGQEIFPRYSLNGIALYQQSDSYTVYTNVFEHINWINEVLN